LKDWLLESNLHLEEEQLYFPQNAVSDMANQKCSVTRRTDEAVPPATSQKNGKKSETS
jgi:hypothetical protein